MQRQLTIAFAAVLSGVIPVACTTGPETSEDRGTLSTGTDTAVEQFLAADPSLKDVLDAAPGYAILPDIVKAAAVVGGAYGKGEVYEKGVKVGYCDLSMGSVGAQLGGDAYSELIVFNDQKALDTFKTSELTFAASATAVAVKPGAARVANHAEGTTTFVRLKGGLMLEAAIGGQRIRFRPL